MTARLPVSPRSPFAAGRLSGLALALVVSACGGGGGGSSTPTTPVTPPVTTPTTPQQVDTVGELFGQVTDENTGAPIAGATVTAGGQTTTTPGDGSYVIDHLAIGRTVITAHAAGYADYSFVAPLNSSQGRQSFSLSLKAVDLSQTFDPTVAQTLTDSTSGAQVSLPAGALVTAGGAAPSGQVTLDMTRIDPGVDSSQMSGDYSTSGGGKIESFGAVDYRFTDAAGNALNLASGTTATIRIPVATGAKAPPATVPLYYFDTPSGLWVQQGNASLAGSGGSSYYTGTVPHFTEWNADQPYTGARISGQVVDESGAGVPGVTVGSIGVDYDGEDLSVTDANGNFTVGEKKNSSANFVASLNNVLTNQVTFAAGTSDATLPTKLVLPSGAGLRITLGTPAISTAMAAYPPCCIFPQVQIPFTVTGPNAAQLQSGIFFRWELSSPLLTCTPIPGAGTDYTCSNGTLATGGETYVVYFNQAAANGGYQVTRVDAGTDNLAGTMEFQASLHYVDRATFSAVLVADVTNPLTGSQITIRSAPLSVTAP